MPLRLDSGIVVLKSFAASAECCDIVDAALRGAAWAPAKVGRYEDDQLIASATDPSLTTASVAQGFNRSFDVIERLKADVIAVAKKEFGLIIGDYSKYGISRYPPGSSVGRHRDTDTFATRRLLTVILYLNQEFEGGKLMFPDLGISYEPRCGDAVIFLSEHFHAVTPILAGTRYCVIFFGQNPD